MCTKNPKTKNFYAVCDGNVGDSFSELCSIIKNISANTNCRKTFNSHVNESGEIEFNNGSKIWVRNGNNDLYGGIIVDTVIVKGNPSNERLEIFRTLENKKQTHNYYYFHLTKNPKI